MKKNTVDRLANAMEAHGLFERRRKRPRTRALAVLLYHRGMSCRNVARHLSTSEESVSPTAVSLWYRRAAFLFNQAKPIKRRKIVVDETSILIQKDAETLVEVFLWVALDSDRKRIVHVALTQGRGGIEALGFIRGVLKRCTNTPFFHVDRGCWYPWALKTAGAPYEVTKGGLRNRVETWNGILKNRLDDFRRRFPHNTCLKELSRWLKAFAYCWNADPLRNL